MRTASWLCCAVIFIAGGRSAPYAQDHHQAPGDVHGAAAQHLAWIPDHHSPDRVTCFAALKKPMKPGARPAIVDFKKGSPDGPPKEFRFTADEISAELGRAGFSGQTRRDFLPRQMFVVYRAN
jgi:hypothetical protein